MSNFGQIIKNTLTGWGAILVRAVLALVMVPVLIGAMGKEGYGLIGLFSVLIALSYVADLGLRSALGRELAGMVVKNDEKGFRELSITAMALYLAIAFLLSVLIYVYSPQLVTFFKVSASLREDAVFLLRIYGATVMITSFVMAVFTSGLTGFMRFDIVNLIQISVTILSNILIIFFIYMYKEHALYIWVLIMMLAASVSLVASFFAYRAICYGGTLSLKLLNIGHLRPLFSLGGQMYVIQLASTISDKANPLIISSFLGTGGVALYQPSAKLSEMFNPVVMTLTSQLYPLTTKFHATGNKENMEQVLCMGTKYTMLLGSLVSAGVFIFAEPFVRLWLFNSLGDDYLVVVQVMMLFAIIDLMTYSSGTQWPIFLGMKKLTFLTYLLFSTAILNVGLSVYFVGYTSVGIVGVLFGTIISKAIRIVALNVYIVGLMKINAYKYLKRAFFRPVICILCTGITGWVLVRSFLVDTWMSLFIMAALTTGAWAVSCLLFGLSREEIAMFKDKLFKKSDRFMLSL